MKNLFKARWMTSLIFLILLFVITGIAAPGFLTYDNIITCFNTIFCNISIFTSLTRNIC